MIARKLLAFSVAFSISVLCISNIAIAAADDTNGTVNQPGPSPLTPFGGPQGQPGGWSPEQQRMHMMRRYDTMNRTPSRVFPMWNLGLMQNKNLSADEARTIAEAALLMFNRRDLKIGDITPKTMRGRDFYIIQIVDVKGNIASVVMLDKDTGIIRPLPKHPQARPREF